jgi:putative MATE family efflux protein
MLARFSLPTIASMIFMSIYSTVDGLFVSRLIGTDALSAVTLIMPIVMISLAFGSMIGTGGNALIAKKIGEGKEQEARQNFSLLLLVTLVISIFMSIIGLSFLEPILRLLGAEGDLFNLSRQYAIPLLILFPLSMFGMVFQISFITVGKAHLGFVVSVLGGITNIVLDYLLIAVFDMGVAGAAIATSIGYSIPSLVGLIYFLLNRNGSLFIAKPRFDIWVILKSCSNGASEMVASLSAGVTSLLFNVILLRMIGSDGIASMAVIMYAQALLSSAFLGYSIGISPIISYNYGKQDVDRLKKIYNISLKSILSVSIFTFVISLILANSLVSIFLGEGTPAYYMATKGFRIFSLSYLFMGINIFSSAMFTALNNGKVSAILSFFRTMIFIVISLMTLPFILGIKGIWLALPIEEFMGICMATYYLRKMKPIYQYA